MNAPATVRLAHRPKPFSLDRELLEFPAGLTLAEMVTAAQPDPVLRAHVVLRLNGEIVPTEWWPRVRPKVGAILQLAMVPRDGQTALRLVLVAAIVVASIYTGGLAAGALGAAGYGSVVAGVGYAIASTAVPIGGSLTVNALTPPAP